MPDQLWDAVLADARTAAKPTQPIQQCALSEIRQHVLRVGCQRCLRIVEIQKADAVRRSRRRSCPGITGITVTVHSIDLPSAERGHN